MKSVVDEIRFLDDSTTLEDHMHALLNEAVSSFSLHWLSLPSVLLIFTLCGS